uniref:Protein kinase domain-containing protein n=1 Tax=Trichuris muris TaxID=70415 RepID=A0A5S6QYD4_TRIMR
MSALCNGRERKKRMDKAMKKFSPFIVKELVKNTWRIEEEISSGAFGAVYKARDVTTRNYVAIKASKTVDTSVRTHIGWEEKVYERMKDSRHCANMISCSIDTVPHFLVLELLGPSLNYLIKGLKGTVFSNGVAAAIIRQCLNAVKDLHNACFIHRDIKPGNFAIGTGSNKSTIYIIDFGLCRKYCHRKESPFGERINVGFCGTPRYASTRAFLKKDLCRADDLISLFYMAYEMIVGELPWKRKLDKHGILSMKLRISPVVMAKQLDANFQLFAEHLMSLSYVSEPDYDMIQELLLNVMQEDNVNESTPFGWEHLLTKAEGNQDGKNDQGLLCDEANVHCAKNSLT